MSARRALQLGVQQVLTGDGTALQEMSVVDARDSAPESEQPLMTLQEAEEFERLQRAESRAPLVDATPNLTLSQGSLDRVRDVRRSFEDASDGDPAEALLEQLIAGETGIGHQLQDLEAAATVLLGRVLTDPQLAMPVARVTREIVALGSAVRRRTENSLNAVAGLRAQRILISKHRLGT